MRPLRLLWLALDIPAPRHVELFPVQVAFEYLGSAEERAWFKNLPTTFELPRETIDKLRAVARRLLNEDPELQKLSGEGRAFERHPTLGRARYAGRG